MKYSHSTEMLSDIRRIWNSWKVVNIRTSLNANTKLITSLAAYRSGKTDGSMNETKVLWARLVLRGYTRQSYPVYKATQPGQWPSLPQQAGKININDFYDPHRGQPPCRGGGALHQWPERFLKSGGEELTKRWPKRESRLLHVTSAFVLVSAPRPITALQPSIYSFTAICLRLHSRLRLYSRYL